jgi:epoxyqueuosine reductase
MDIRARHTSIVKETARSLGFSFCGISKAEFLEDDAPRLEAWLRRGYHGKMGYLEQHFDKRLDPTLLVPGAKSVVSLIYNYFPAKTLSHPENLKIARYAYGKDYHIVLKDKLAEMLSVLRDEIGDTNGRIFVDSAPVMERSWAKRSGIGWTGKNSLLLNRTMGSYFFLAELIIDLDLEPDAPTKDYCGSCTACMDACPTDAITEPYVVDASRCISYLTIELKESIPNDFKGKMDNWIFGCDICQEVCPWNSFANPHRESQFDPNISGERMSSNDWLEMTDEVFAKVFAGSPLNRTKLSGMQRNVRFVKDNPNEDET